ncbi:MAG TPA: hypothetical protein VF188_17450 [Longimicrobiales bacterium]
MQAALDFFAILGIAAVAWRIVRAVFRAARQGVDAFLAGEVAKTRERRGDVTGMDDAEAHAARARRARWRALGAVVFWSAVLALPALLPTEAAPIYAAYALLWLLPGKAPRRTDIAPYGR